MSQTSGDKPAQPATERAEAMLENAGQRLGYFSALAVQRIQQATTSIRQEADRIDTPDAADATTEGQSNGASAGTEHKLPQVTLPTAKAEEVVDRAGQRISQYAAVTGWQLQRAMARLREEAEDMWAEAQNLRQQNFRKPR